MAVATRTDSFLAPTITQQTLYDAVKQAMTNAGYPAPTQEFTSGTDRVVVYAIVLDNTKTFGTTYLRVRVTTTFIIGQQLFSTWNTATSTGTNGSTEYTSTAFLSTAQLNFTALNGGTEYKLALLYQGALFYPLGYFAPVNKPAWWDLNAWNYCLHPVDNTFTTIRGVTVTPYAANNTNYDTNLNYTRMGTANQQTNRRDILPGILIYNQANQGISGRTSDDLVMVAGSGATRFDTLQAPGDSKQYLLLNPASGGLAVRVA